MIARHSLKSNPIIKSHLSLPYWLKRFKHAIKRNIIQFSPTLYWQLRYLLLSYPEPELPLIDQFCAKGLNAIDVGANYGMYTYYASKRFAKCYSFEPQPYFIKTLGKAYRNTNVELFQIALSDHAGIETMRMPVCDRGYSTIDPHNQLEGKVDESDGIETFEVKTCKLDDYSFKQVGFLKVDVEGHELEVLQGAAETIRSSKPVIYVEVEERHREFSVQGVESLLAGFGYNCYFLQHKKLLPFSQFLHSKSQNQETKKDYVRNFIFFHKENLPAFVS